MKADLYNKFVEKQELQENEEQKNIINNKQEKDVILWLFIMKKINPNGLKMEDIGIL